MIVRGVKFGNYHSFNDWGLYLAAYHVASPPEPQLTLVSVPGRDGSLDLSQSLDGTIHYADRTLEFRFLCIASRTAWPTIYRKIQNTIHGKRMDIRVDDDPGYHYTGRIRVKPPNYAKRDFTVEVEATVEPFKYADISTAEQWKWDPFNFETGIIREYGHMAVDGSLAVDVYGFDQPVTPSVTVHSAADMSVRVGGKTYQLPGNRTTTLDFNATSGKTAWTFSGTGDVSIIMRERSL